MIEKIKYHIIGSKHIFLIGLLCVMSQTLWAQMVITGSIKDKDGYPLAGVTVSTQDKKDITVTAGDGLFSIAIGSSTKLIFRMSSFLTQTLLVEKQKSVKIVLKKDPNEQMVDVAYGQQNKLSVTSAMATISGEELTKTPVPTLSNTLYGLLPGLTVMQGKGEPGYDAPSMNIRGLGTFRDNRFRTYVDGFETPIDQLSTYEVENVSVLKDAAALALYGLHGANGAIIVTTKHGFDGKTKMNFNMVNGWQSPISLPKFLGSFDYANLYNEALANDGQAPRYTPADLAAYKAGSDTYLHPDVNWYNEVLRKSAPTSNYNVSFSGGNKSMKYFVFLGYMRNQGLYANTDNSGQVNSNADFQRYNFRSNIDIDLTKIVSASVDFGGRIEDRSFPGFHGPSLWYNMSLIPPNAYPVRNPNGSWGGNGIYLDNPVASVLARGINSTHTRDLQATVRFKEKLDMITKGLMFSQAISVSNWFAGAYNKTKDYQRYELSAVKDVNGVILKTDSGKDSIKYTPRGKATDYSVDEGGNNQWHRTNIETALNYDRTFGIHGISAMVMYHQDEYLVSGNNVPYAYQSVMGRMNYSNNNRYFTELGFSYSGSENFLKGKRFGLFPSISAGWIVSNEDFLKNNSILNFLKVRGSIGLLGNDNIGGGRFTYNQYYYYTGGYTLGVNNDQGMGSIGEGTLGNPNITWEKSTKVNLGIESKLFNKIDLNVDVFYDRRTAILADRSASIPGVLGVGAPNENVGKVTNKGFELELNYSDKVGEFEYFVTGKAFYSINKIDYMDEVLRPFDYLYRTGQEIGQPFGLQAIGLFKDQADITASPVQTFSPVQPGDIKYKDQNGDKIIDQNDEIAIGKSSIPDFSYSLNAGFKVKGFDFQAFFHGVTNRTVFLSGPMVWAFQSNAKVGPIAEGRWTPATASTATYPRLTTLPNDNNYRNSTYWQRNGSFLRLRNVEFGYTIPASLTNRLKITKARIYVNGVNLITWDSVQVVDPETMDGYPALKSYNVGISVNF